MREVEDLTAAVERLDLRVGRLRREFRRRTVAVVALAAALVVAVAVGTLVQVNVSRRIEQNNARWCPLTQALVLQPGDPPPNARGQRLISWAAQMTNEFHCPEGDR